MGAAAPHVTTGKREMGGGEIMPPDANFQPGSTIRIHGLQARPEMNDALALCLEYSPDLCRWSVQPLKSEFAESFWVRPQNMLLIKEQNVVDPPNAELRAPTQDEKDLREGASNGQGHPQDLLAQEPSSESGNSNLLPLYGVHYSWIRHYEILIKWRDDPELGAGKHCNVPSTAVYLGANLGDWLRKQRGRLRDACRGKVSGQNLTDVQTSQLKKLEFAGQLCLDVPERRSWEESFKLLLAWRDDPDGGGGEHCNIAQEANFRGHSLGRWLSLQMSRFRNSGLTDTRKQQLQELVDAGLLDLKRKALQSKVEPNPAAEGTDEQCCWPKPSEQCRCTQEGCGASFADAVRLKRHMLKHTGEKPWLCPVEDCDFRCSLSHNLKQHLDCVHRDCINSFPSAQQDGLGVQTEASAQFQSWLAIQKHKWRHLRGDEWQIQDQFPHAPRIAHGNQSNDDRWLLQYEALVAWGEDPDGGRGKTCEVPHGAQYQQMQLGTWLQNQKAHMRGTNYKISEMRRQKMQDLVDEGKLRPLNCGIPRGRPRAIPLDLDGDGRFKCPAEDCDKTYTCTTAVNAHLKSKHPEMYKERQHKACVVDEIVPQHVNRRVATSRAVELPEGWTVTHHVSSTGVSNYKRYVGPNGEHAQSVQDAWRKHNASVANGSSKPTVELVTVRQIEPGSLGEDEDIIMTTPVTVATPTETNSAAAAAAAGESSDAAQALPEAIATELPHGVVPMGVSPARPPPLMQLELVYGTGPEVAGDRTTSEKDGRRAGPLPEGWTVTHHVSSTGVSSYKRYVGPNGEHAQSVKDAWRKHSQALPTASAGCGDNRAPGHAQPNTSEPGDAAPVVAETLAGAAVRATSGTVEASHLLHRAKKKPLVQLSGQVQTFVKRQRIDDGSKHGPVGMVNGSNANAAEVKSEMNPLYDGIRGANENTESVSLVPDTLDTKSMVDMVGLVLQSTDREGVDSQEIEDLD